MNPTRILVINSKMRSTKNATLIGIPSKAASAIEAVKAKTKITTTSERTVTPKVTEVKGPFARNSWMIAIADDGERAMRIDAIIIEIAAFSNALKSAKIEIDPLTK